jgi:hypothetical protein
MLTTPLAWYRHVNRFVSPIPFRVKPTAEDPMVLVLDDQLHRSHIVMPQILDQAITNLPPHSYQQMQPFF